MFARAGRYGRRPAAAPRPVPAGRIGSVALAVAVLLGGFAVAWAGGAAPVEAAATRCAAPADPAAAPGWAAGPDGGGTPEGSAGRGQGGTPADSAGRGPSGAADTVPVDPSQGPAGPARGAAVPPGCPPRGAVTAAGAGLARAGEPFVWLADTAWSLVPTLTRSETVAYLDARAAQGFTVVEMAAVLDGPLPDQYGDLPLDPATGVARTTAGADADDDARYDYWDHLDYVLAEASARGLVVALAPVRSAEGPRVLAGPGPGRALGEFLGRRYGADPAVVWALGGPGADPQTWTALAEGLATGGATQVVTARAGFDGPEVIPVRGATACADSTGSSGADATVPPGAAAPATGAGPRGATAPPAGAGPDGRPVLAGDPRAEGAPGCDGTTGPDDVRRALWADVLGGAAGAAYAHIAVAGSPGGAADLSGPAGAWSGALVAPGAEQLRHLLALLESRPPLVATEGVRADGGTAVPAARAGDATSLVAYLPAGAAVTVPPGLVTGPVRAWWYDPGTGAVAAAGEAAGRYVAPAGDRVLVIDAVAGRYGEPGSGHHRGGADTGAAPTGVDLDGRVGAGGRDPGTVGPAATGAAGGAAGRDTATDGSEPAGPGAAGPEVPAAPGAADPSGRGTGGAPPATDTVDPVWDRLATCESGGDWAIDTGNGYFGGLQFDAPTWREFGGGAFAPRAHLATREQQVTIAERVRDARGGYGSWPACAAELGLPR